MKQANVLSAAPGPMLDRIETPAKRRGHRAWRQVVILRLEVAAVDVDLAITPARLRFGQAVSADRRLAEYGRGYIGVVHLDRVVVKERLGDGTAFGDRDRRQIDPVGHVADRIDVRNTAARPFVDDDRAVLGGLDADLGQT